MNFGFRMSFPFTSSPQMELILKFFIPVLPVLALILLINLRQPLVLTADLFKWRQYVEIGYE